jgi:hypothetical protein
VDALGIAAPVVIQEHLDILVTVEQVDTLVNLEFQAIAVLVFQDSLAEAVILVYQGVLDIQEFLVIRVAESLVIRAQAVILEFLVILVHLDIVVSREQAVILV